MNCTLGQKAETESASSGHDIAPEKEIELDVGQEEEAICPGTPRTE